MIFLSWRSETVNQRFLLYGYERKVEILGRVFDGEFAFTERKNEADAIQSHYDMIF